MPCTHAIAVVAAHFLSSALFFASASISSRSLFQLPSPAMSCIASIFASAVAACVLRGVVAMLLRDYARYLRTSTARYQIRLRRLRALEQPVQRFFFFSTAYSHPLVFTLMCAGAHAIVFFPLWRAF